MFASAIFFCTILSLAVDSSSARSTGQRVQTILESIFQNYDTRIRPNGTITPNGPVEVAVSMEIRGIQQLCHHKMELTFEAVLKQRWIDDRFAFNHLEGRIKQLNLHHFYEVWNPDISFHDFKKGYFYNFPGSYMNMKISNYGTVSNNQRFRVTISCPMDLKRFPFGYVVCVVQLESYGHTDDDIHIRWKHIDPVQVTKDMNPPNFNFMKFEIDDCNLKNSKGTYSCIKFSLHFVRESSHYIFRYFIPTGMVVIISWICFWLNPKDITVRLLLSTATLYAMSYEASRVANDLPKLTYTTAIDVWSGMCVAFVFSVMIETIVAYHMSRRNSSHSSSKAKVIKQSSDGDSAPEGDSIIPIIETAGPQPTEEKPSHDVGKYKPSDLLQRFGSYFLNRDNSIDFISRFAFPVMFAIFLFIYTITNLH